MQLSPLKIIIISLLLGIGFILVPVCSLFFYSQNQFPQNICCGNSHYCNITYDCYYDNKFKIDGTFILQYNKKKSTFQCSEGCVRNCDHNYNCIFFENELYPLQYVCNCPHEKNLINLGIPLFLGIIFILIAILIIMLNYCKNKKSLTRTENPKLPPIMML